QMMTCRSLLLARLAAQQLAPLALRRPGGSPLPLQPVTRRRLGRVGGVQPYSPAQLLDALPLLVPLGDQRLVRLRQTFDLLTLRPTQRQQQVDERLCARHLRGRPGGNVGWHGTEILPLRSPAGPPPAPRPGSGRTYLNGSKPEMNAEVAAV